MQVRHAALFLLAMALCTLSIASAQETSQPPTIQPGQLRQIPQSEIHNILSSRVSLGREGDAPINAATPTLPLFPYTDGGFNGTIVGTAPTTPVSTTVPTVIVPVVLNITQNGATFTFDPRATDPGCLGGSNTALSLTQSSPIFTSTTSPIVLNGVSEGNTQYIDAFQRAEFATTVAPAHHTLLSGSVGAPLTVSLNEASAGTPAAVFSVSGVCGTNPGPVNTAGTLGIVNANVLNPLLQSYISANGINASQFVLFVLYNTTMSAGAANNLNNCCILGFHMGLGGSVQNPGQTYGIADFEGRDQTVFGGVSDTSVLVHEVGEWANDPSGVNSTPAWGNIGQVSGCQGNLEVGDPLSGTLAPAITQAGFTFHLQELAFFSWFYHDSPSQGAGGKYSSNGTFSGFAKACPPGGTN
ncbi:MAG TPA: hypothetical protein VKZ53_25720 [Candidatus Angelobacter sp.]|nr:hypothetical protein [Candidatus Angelobacter sp.]